MPKTQTKNPHPIIKILSDLNLLPEKGEDVDAKSYKRALMTGVNLIESSSKDKTGDERSRMLREELIRVRKERDTAPPKEINVKEKKSTIKGAKLLPGTTFRPDDVKPADVDKNQGDTPSLMPDRLDSIAKTVDSIALLLRRQFKVEKKQQRDSRIQQDKINKGDREDDLEKKPKDKKTGGLPKAIAKPALSFFDKIKKFFLNIVIGSGVMALFDWIKNPANAEKITQFKDFLINNAGWILGGLAAIALLPIALSLVSVVQGVLAGLSLLGPLLPALPWILGGLLVGAVAWWIGKKINKSIVGGEGFSKARDDNLKRLEAHGIKKSGLALDPDTGEEIYVKRWEGDTGASGDDKYGSIEGRPWGPGDKGKNSSVKINLREAEHQKWYSDYYGSEKLKEKLDALNLYDKTKASIIEKKKEMDSEVNKNIKSFNESKTDKAYESSGLPETVGGRIRMFMNDPKEYNKRRKKYSKDLEKNRKQNLVDNEKIRTDYNKEVLGTIDKNVKPDTNVPGPSTKKKGDNLILDGGKGNQQASSVGGSGTGGSSGTPKIGSQDPNNYQTVSTMSMYNMGSA